MKSRTVVTALAALLALTVMFAIIQPHGTTIQIPVDRIWTIWDPPRGATPPIRYSLNRIWRENRPTGPCLMRQEIERGVAESSTWTDTVLTIRLKRPMPAAAATPLEWVFSRRAASEMSIRHPVRDDAAYRQLVPLRYCPDHTY